MNKKYLENCGTDHCNERVGDYTMDNAEFICQYLQDENNLRNIGADIALATTDFMRCRSNIYGFDYDTVVEFLHAHGIDKTNEINNLHMFKRIHDVMAGADTIKDRRNTMYITHAGNKNTIVISVYGKECSLCRVVQNGILIILQENTVNQDLRNQLISLLIIHMHVLLMNHINDTCENIDEIDIDICARYISHISVVMSMTDVELDEVLKVMKINNEELDDEITNKLEELISDDGENNR